MNSMHTPQALKKQTFAAMPTIPLLGTLLLCAGSLSLNADEITFQQEFAPNSSYTGSQAVFIRSDQAGTNSNDASGIGQRLIVGHTGSGVLNGLLSFDISAIPTGSTIDSVSLSLFYNGDGGANETGPFTLNLHQLTQSYNEAEATWNEYSTGNSWATAGGDFSATILSSASDNLATVSAGEELSFASSSNFVSIVQSAYDGTGVVNLLVKLSDPELLLSENDNGRRIFDFEADDNHINGADTRPAFTVSYTVPEPSTASLLLGLGAVGYACAMRRRRG